MRQELQKTETKKLRLLRGERVTDSPTSLTLMEEIDYIPILGRLTPEAYSRYADVADDIPEEHLEILRLAGFGSEIYCEPLTPN
ncbi:hypothetical protein [Limnochorda pilosa]|uniref:Uncharacterized protein n=1 Tax=Limnochorda pilosa TaxID=1555112 RepID=A0A0K2SLT1_LIMPI|nr:hypothetical protein [Limnochorda pilosa]BAS28081.1 hypothetical protein LIP_2240 [Limnochorda pilosa]